MWLDKNNAGSYVKKFLENEVTGKQLVTFNNADLEQLGVVLQMEQQRLVAAIARHVRSKDERAWKNSTADSSDDGMHSVSSSNLSGVAAAAAAAAVRNKTSVADEDAGVLALQKLKKVNVQVTFKNGARGPLRIVLPSASCTRTELSSTLRNKFGRRYEVQEMKATDGTSATLGITVSPMAMELSADMFSLLDGITMAALVTDNVGVMLFANDSAWDKLTIENDVCDQSVEKVLDLSKYHARGSEELCYVDEDMPTKNAECVAKNSKRPLTVDIRPVKMSGKLVFYVWSIRDAE